jgi:NADH-quinone oxidoreductase subunit F
VSPIQSGIKYFRDEFRALCARNKGNAERRELAGAH